MQRKRISDEETAQVQEDIETIKTVPPEVWHKTEDWGRTKEQLSEQQKTVAYNLAGRVRNNMKISDYERTSGIYILDIVTKKAPKLLEEIDEINAKNNHKPDGTGITFELIKKIVQWDKKNKNLKNFEFVFMTELVEGKKNIY